MSNEFEWLKEIGAQKVHEQTHISRKHVESILNETFENMTRIQFLGFVSILEREYNIKLDELKERDIDFLEQDLSTDERKNKVFRAPNKRKKSTLLYIIIALTIFVLFAYYNMSQDSSSPDYIKVPAIDNTIIDSAQKKIEEKISLIAQEKAEELKKEQESFESEEISESIFTPTGVEVLRNLSIIPKIKVWIGYIDINTNKKQHQFIQEEFSMDPDKEWLILLGHGNVEVELNGVKQGFSGSGNLRFAYQNGELRKIDIQEFKSLNKGSKW